MGLDHLLSKEFTFSVETSRMVNSILEKFVSERGGRLCVFLILALAVRPPALWAVGPEGPIAQLVRAPC